MKSFKVPIKSEDIYADPAGDVRTRYHTFNYKVTIPRQKQKSSHINERWIGWKLIMKEIAALRRSMYSYITSRKQRSHRSVSSNEKQNLKLQTMPR